MNHSATLILLETEALRIEWDKILDKVLQIGYKLLIALLIFFVGKKLISWVMKLFSKLLERGQVDAGVASFLSSMAKIGLYLLLAIVLCDQIGIGTASFIAVLGSAGLTLGLAFQGSLSNFAGGVLILILKPFRVGDYIIVNDSEGTVTGIDIFYTNILTPDNRKIVLPNGQLSNSSLVNVTNETKRRVDLSIPIGYDNDIREAKQVLQKVYEQSEFSLKDTLPDIFVSSFDDHSVGLMFRVWTQKENYWPMRSELLEMIKYAFDEHGINIPYHQLDLYVKNANEFKK